MNTIGRRDFLGAGAAGVGLSLVRPSSARAGSDGVETHRVYTQAEIRDHSAFYLQKKHEVYRRLMLEKLYEDHFPEYKGNEDIRYGASFMTRFLLEVITNPVHGEALRVINVFGEENVKYIKDLPRVVENLKRRGYYQEILERPYPLPYDPFKDA